VRLRFNEAQMRLYEAYRWFRDHRMPVRIIICKARRAGLSTGVEALMFDDTIRNSNTNSLIVANQLGPSTNVLAMCSRFWQNLPKAMTFTIDGKPFELEVKPPMDPKYGKVLPVDKLEFAPPLSSKMFIASAKSVDQYLSFDFSNIHFTEASRFDDAEELFRAVAPTLSDDVDTAQYIESTPAGQTGKGEWFYEQCIDAQLRSRTKYGETKLVFVPWHEMKKSFWRGFSSMEERSKFEHNLKSDYRDKMRQFPHIELEQMNWYVTKCNMPPFNKKPELMMQEYPDDLVTGFLVSGESVLSIPALKRLASNMRHPKWQGDVYWGDNDQANKYLPIYDLVRRPQFLSRGEAETRGFDSHTTERTWNNLKVWRWPEKGERVIISADVGKGNPLTEDGDYSTACVIVLNEFGRDELIMTWRGKLNTILFAELLAALSWGIRFKVGSRVIAPKLVPEWTGPGTATCTYLDQKSLYEVFPYRMPGVKGMPYTKHLGWEANSKTKPYSVNWMVRTIEQDMIDIPSEEVVLELSSYRMLDRYGDEASYGGVGQHDDFASSLQIGIAVCRLETSTLPTEWDYREIDMDEAESTGDLTPFDEIGANNLEESPYEEAEDDEFDTLDEREAALFW
jgi:hypothetical protein